MFTFNRKKKHRASTKGSNGETSEPNSRRKSSDSLRSGSTDEASQATLNPDRAPERLTSTAATTNAQNTQDNEIVRSRRDSDRTVVQPLTGEPSNSVRDGSNSFLTNGKIKRRPTAATEAASSKNLDLIESEPPQIDLEKLVSNLKNPSIRREAAKLAGRAEKFQVSLLQIAALRGYKTLAGISVKAELQKIFELADAADANDGVQMLRDFSDATSFKGKLSLFEPTTESSRALVRVVQLFRAVEGDGSYDTVRRNIQQLKSNAEDLRRMARDASLLQGLDNAQYVDENRLLRLVNTGNSTLAQQISQTTREWHIEQASLMKAYRDLAGKDATLQKKLALTMLQSFAKAAPLGTARAEELNAQVSPLANQQGLYHRSAPTNPLLNTVLEAYCQDMALPMGSIHLVDNSTFREVMAREYAVEGVNTQIGSILEYEKALQTLFKQAALGRFPQNTVVLDITNFFKLANLPPSGITGVRDVLEGIFLDEAEKFFKTHPNVDQQKFADMMKSLQIGALTSYKGVDVLLTPKFLFKAPTENESPLQSALLSKAESGSTNAHMAFFESIEHSLIHSGYRLDPIQARKAWLEVVDPSAILSKYGIQITELATSDKPTPKVFANFNDFTKHPTFQQFEKLAKAGSAPPYLKTLPVATVNMLRGVAAHNFATGGVDKVMQDQGLDEILQTAYYRMLNAMASAVDSQAFLQSLENRPTPSQISESFVEFMNEIEVIQQQVATIISLVEPHGANAFGDSIRARLTDPAGPSNKPVIPSGLDEPGVQLKPSAMHCLASILSSVEALKKGKDLNVCVVKDHYYESAGAITSSKTYSVSQFDGDAVRGPDGISTKPLDPASIKGKKPLDLYVCDFHHNISLDRNHYQSENLQHHVDELYRNNLVANKFTVAIDCTIDFVNSPDVQAFLEHNKARIAAGQLNVVLFRSAQKFDMFGMDNYYGGFSVNINNHTDFAAFNTRMELPEDQLKGISLQGLSHIGVSASPDMDEYRSALMANTKRFYNALPPGLIWSPSSTSVMQVAKTDDPNAVFLDIKFPGNAAATDAFMSRLRAFVEEKGLPLTGRASFGFATTNLNLIHSEKTRLTPGLEGPEIQDRYIAFLEAVYNCANEAAQLGVKQGKQGAELNSFIAEQIKTMSL